jgi:hypothetical protein
MGLMHESPFSVTDFSPIILVLLLANIYILIIKLEQGERSRYRDWLLAGRHRRRSSSLGRVKNFIFFASSRPVLGPSQSPIQWIPGTVSPGVKRAGPLQLVPMSGKRGSIIPLPHTPLWRSAYLVNHRDLLIIKDKLAHGLP